MLLVMNSALMESSSTVTANIGSDERRNQHDLIKKQSKVSPHDKQTTTNSYRYYNDDSCSSHNNNNSQSISTSWMMDSSSRLGGDGSSPAATTRKTSSIITWSRSRRKPSTANKKIELAAEDAIINFSRRRTCQDNEDDEDSLDLEESGRSHSIRTSNHHNNHDSLTKSASGRTSLTTTTTTTTRSSAATLRKRHFLRASSSIEEDDDNNDLEASENSLGASDLFEMMDEESNTDMYTTPRHSPLHFNSVANRQQPATMISSMHKSLSALRSNRSQCQSKHNHHHHASSLSAFSSTTSTTWRHSTPNDSLSHSSYPHNNNSHTASMNNSYHYNTHRRSSLPAHLLQQQQQSQQQSTQSLFHNSMHHHRSVPHLRTRPVVSRHSVQGMSMPALMDYQDDDNNTLSDIIDHDIQSKQKAAPKRQVKNTSWPKRVIMNRSSILLVICLTFFCIGFLFLYQRLDNGSWFQKLSSLSFLNAKAQQRQSQLMELLLETKGIDPERLQDPKSHAYQAVQWLAFQDPLQLTAENTTTIVLQRFALATLYFATANDDTKQSALSDWMTAAPVCDWQGISCELVDESDWFDAAYGHGKLQKDGSVLVLGDSMLENPELADDNNKDTAQQPGSSINLQSPDPVMDVVKLELSNKDLAGTLPPEIRLLSQLTTLNLSHNKLQGSLPQDDALGHFMRLTSIDVSHNQLTGPIPTALADNLIMHHVNLAHNRFSGRIPAACTFNWRNLLTLQLNNNILSGTLEDRDWGHFKRLQALNLSHNHLQGALASSLASLSTLITLELQHNLLIGTLPAELMESTSLETLDVSHNFLHGVVPDGLKFGAAVEYSWKEVKLCKNQLMGSLPRTLGYATGLKLLDLSGNHFTGRIPHEWGYLSQLEILRLQQNKIEGTMPQHVGRMVNLQEFQYQDNLIPSTIPIKIKRHLTHLKEEFGAKAPDEETKETVTHPRLSVADTFQDLRTGMPPDEDNSAHSPFLADGEEM